MANSIQLDYDPAEDRLLLTLTQENDTDKEAVPTGPRTLLLTRRVVAAWRPALRSLAESSASVSPQLHPAARAAVSAAHHEVMAAQARKGSARPVMAAAAGETMLVKQALCGRNKNGGWVLKFQLMDGGATLLSLSGATLHAFIAMLDQRIARADWGLPILLRSSSAPPAGQMH